MNAHVFRLLILVGLVGVAPFAATAAHAGETAAARQDLPIHSAARLNGGPEVARLLAADPKLREARTALGWTPLHLAATNSDSGPLRVLIAAGADPNARDDEGSTPLHLAAYTQHAAHAQLLLEAGADPLAKNHAGRDVLSLARKTMANEAAGVISLWILKGCKPKQPC